MTTTLLLRMAGPTQGWDSRRRRADYGRVATVSSLEWWGPTASGVAGLLAAALGRPRTHDCGDLLACEYIVRTDRPGRPRAEFRSRHERGEDGAIARPRHFVETVIDDAAYLVGSGGFLQHRL